jgi:hypothetical protein
MRKPGSSTPVTDRSCHHVQIALTVSFTSSLCCVSHAGFQLVPRAWIAQATRASLFATAAVTTLNDRLCSRVTIQLQRPPDRPSAIRTSERAPFTNCRRIYASPRLLMPSRRSLSPLECCLGVSPSGTRGRLLRLNNYRHHLETTSSLLAVLSAPGGDQIGVHILVLGHPQHRDPRSCRRSYNLSL